ncbi:MAG: hypothetical protein V3V00_07430 [Saprospiraceae bacterium]
MKATFYTLGILILMLYTSCKSVQTLVDKGDYDAAIALATKKMRGGKVKKTKHIKSLEKAFLKVNNDDLNEIHYLRDIDDLDAHERIFDIGKKIAYRQKLVRPYLPLVGKDGYRGQFKFINTNTLLSRAAKKITLLSYNKGVDYLSRARNSGYSEHARAAYYAFMRAADFNPDFNELVKLQDEARAFGIDHVLIEILFDSDLFLPYDIAHYLKSVRYIPRSEKWVHYYNESDTTSSFDFIARLIIDDINISPERERRRIFFEEKEIEDGEEYVLDDRGNVAKDSLGNDIKKPKYTLVQAKINEVSREKYLNIRAQLKIVDVRDGRTLTQLITAEAKFDDLVCIVRGDERALSEKTQRSVKDFPLDFPTDAELLLQTGDEIKQAFRYKLNKMIKEYRDDQYKDCRFSSAF